MNSLIVNHQRGSSLNNATNTQVERYTVQTKTFGKASAATPKAMVRVRGSVPNTASGPKMTRRSQFRTRQIVIVAKRMTSADSIR